MDNFMLQELLITVANHLLMGMSWNLVSSFAITALPPCWPVGGQLFCVFYPLKLRMMSGCGCWNAICWIFCLFQVCHPYLMVWIPKFRVSEIWRTQSAWGRALIRTLGPPVVFPV